MRMISEGVSTRICWSAVTGRGADGLGGGERAGGWYRGLTVTLGAGPSHGSPGPGRRPCTVNCCWTGVGETGVTELAEALVVAVVSGGVGSWVHTSETTADGCWTARTAGGAAGTAAGTAGGDGFWAGPGEPPSLLICDYRANNTQRTVGKRRLASGCDGCGGHGGGRCVNT